MKEKITELLTRLNSHIERGHGQVTIEIFDDLTCRLLLEMWGLEKVATKYKGEDFNIAHLRIAEHNPDWLSDIEKIVENLNKENVNLDFLTH